MTHLGMTREHFNELKNSPALEEFVKSFEVLVGKRRDMIWKIRDIKENAKKHKADSLIVTSLGALGAVGGAILTFTPLAPIGIGMAALGTGTIAVTQGICYLTDTDKKKVLNILKEDWQEEKICANMLDTFNGDAKELALMYGFDYNTAAALLTGYLVSFGIDALPSGVREGGKFFAAGLRMANKCPIFQKKCIEYVALTGVRSITTKVCIPVSALIDVVTVGIDWCVDKKVDKIDEKLESLQSSIDKISKLIYALSEDFRKNGSWKKAPSS